MVSSSDMEIKINDKVFLPAAVIVAGLIIAGAVVWNGSRPATPDSPQAAGTGTVPSPSVNIEDVEIAGHPYIGKENAPVTIAFWSDFQCPYCKSFEVGHDQIPTPAAFPDIIKNYIDTGKAKIVFLDLPLTQLHPNALNMALYGRAVWKLYPEQYVAWREAILTRQGEDFGNASSVDALNATIAGLDAARIKADVQANKAAYQKMIDADTAQAGKFGVNATPSFIIGTQLLAGAYPYQNFEDAIKAALGK